MTLRTAGYLATFIGGMVFCLLLFSVGVVDRVDGIPGTQDDPILSLPTYLTFIGVMMTAVTAVLAAIAVFIGVVAAYTFRELSDKAANAAQARISELLSDEAIKKRIDEVAFGSKKPTLDELEKDFDPTDAGER